MWESHGQVPALAGTYPAEGNQPSPTAKIETRTMPTTNGGVTEMIVVKPVIARSIQVVRRSAASVPSAKPPTMPMINAAVATDRLMDRPLPINVAMSAPLAQLTPRSPCRMFSNHVQYWARKGRSRPHARSIRATASGVALSPSWICAGLSPLIALSAKVTKVATRKTGTKIETERARVTRPRPAARRALATATCPRRSGTTA